MPGELLHMRTCGAGFCPGARIANCRRRMIVVEPPSIVAKRGRVYCAFPPDSCLNLQYFVVDHKIQCSPYPCLPSMICTISFELVLIFFL